MKHKGDATAFSLTMTKVKRRKMMDHHLMLNRNISALFKGRKLQFLDFHAKDDTENNIRNINLKIFAIKTAFFSGSYV